MNITILSNIATGETSQVITSRHFSSLLSMSNLTSLALDQLKGKYNTYAIHILWLLIFFQLLSKKSLLLFVSFVQIHTYR